MPRDVRAAIAHLRANLHRAVPIAELAAQAGVAQRTLHEHFQTFIGLAPGSYGARLRLGAVRRALQEPAGASVTSAALGYGFSHLGRFSRQYRQAFGETPTATQRAAAALSCPEIVSPAPRGGRPEILILPFTAPAPLANLAELIADSIATAIAGDAAVSVARPRAAPERRRDIRARYVIRGRIEQVGEQLRIIATLADAKSGVHLWGDACDGRSTSPFSAIDRLVAAVLGAVVPNIRKAEIARVARRRPEDLEAYELCLRVHPLLAANTPATARQALDLLYRAIERDPDLGLAAGLAAWAHAQLVLQTGSISPAIDAAQARTLSERAGVLDPDDAAVLTARCMVHTMAGEFGAAGSLIARALAASPRSSWAWERSGWLKILCGNAAAGIACFGRSLRLDRLNPASTTQLLGIAAGCFEDGRYELATRWMQRALDAQPGAAWVNRTLAVSYALIGERHEATRSLEALRRYRPDIHVADVVSTMRFPPVFVSRVANGLIDLGLPS